MKNNIREIRRRNGLTQETVAELAGTTKGQISKLETAEKLTTTWMEKIARALGVEPFELIADIKAAVRIPLVGWVSAGKFVAARQVDGLQIDDCEMIECSGVSPGRCIALTVDGDSMNLVAAPGSVIVVDISNKEMTDGRYYVVASNGGEATFKRFRRNPKRLEPVSSNPTHEIMFPDDEIRVIGRVIKVISDI